MRIAFDHQTFVLQQYGGIPRYFVQLAVHLQRMEQSVGVFAPLFQNRYLSSIPSECIYGRYVRRYPPKLSNLFLKINQSVAKRKIEKWQPDIVHETYYSKSRVTPNNCPKVITVYDMIHELFDEEFEGNSEIKRIKRVAVEDADHIICISENTKRDLQQAYDTPSSKISVVHLGFDQYTTIQTNAAFSMQDLRPFLLFVGGRDGYKNFSGLLSAMASSDRLMRDFDIVAFGGGSFSSKELKTIKKLGFNLNQIRQVSGSDEILGVLYSSACGLVYPSKYEGFGIPPLEAMAKGCPVMVSNVSSMPEVCGNAVQYFSPSDVESIRESIETVVYSESRSVELKRLGHERLNLFSWSKCASQTLDIYRNLV